LAEVRDAGSPDVPASYVTQAFKLNVDIPQLGPISDLSTTIDSPVAFALTSTDPLGAGVVYTVVDAATFGTPANVSVSIDQSTGFVTLTPADAFAGEINLLAGVRSSSSSDAPANYDTQAFKLSVTTDATAAATPSAPTGLAVDSSSNTGTFAGNGYLTSATPTLTVTAASGATVQFEMNGTVIATGTETGTGTGVFTATLPAGKLAVGANSITATAATTDGTSGDSTALSLIYAPDYSGGLYVVPGTAGTSETLAIDWTEKNAAFNNELGYFVVDSADGSIGGVAPGSAGYAQAALSSSTRTTLFTKGQKAGATTTATLQGGQMIVFYLIQDNTTANFLAANPSDTEKGNNNAAAPLAFFSLAAANPDSMKHTQIVADSTTGNVQYNWEDLLSLGDSDFNDAAITVGPSSDAAPHDTLHAPGTGLTIITLNATLHNEKESSLSGDVGVYFAADESGTVDGLDPGDSGYAEAALAAENFKVLFDSGASGTQQVTVPAGDYLGFYLITSGTTSDFTTNNPTNSSSGAQALFSFDAANPDAVNHFRWYSPGQQATDPNVVQLHAMTKLAGGASDYDGFTIDLSFSA
jgi:hypothetical protein